MNIMRRTCRCYNKIITFGLIESTYRTILRTTRVLDNAQTAVFTSAISILSTSKFCFSGVSKRPEFCEVCPIFEWWAYGHCQKDSRQANITHIPQGAGSAASSHDNIITAAGQSCTTKQSLQSASGTSGFGCQHDINYIHMTYVQCRAC